jgi:alpha-tubulin suppressor-like RCC1 family protein
MGEKHTILLALDGSAYTCGSNEYGQLGLGSFQRIFLLPNKIPLQNVAHIGAGVDYIFFQTKNRMFYVAGRNSEGQLGCGDNLNRHALTYLAHLRNDLYFKQFALAHVNSSYILSHEGRIYVAGANDFGGLMLGFASSKSSPTELRCTQDPKSCIDVVLVATGSYHTLLLSGDGELRAFGANANGQLGLNDRRDRPVPTRVPFFMSNDTIKNIIAGGSHSLLITTNSQVYSFGQNNYGQLGHGNNFERLVPTHISKMIRGKYVDGCVGKEPRGGHSIIFTTEGKLVVFGKNEDGQLGLGNQDEQDWPGKNDLIHYASQIACGGDYTLVLNKLGELFSFGKNEYGQLGTGDLDFRSVPTHVKLQHVSSMAAGVSHAIVLTSEGALYSFGSNQFGQLGMGVVEPLRVPHPVHVSLYPFNGTETPSFIHASLDNTFVRTNSNRTYVFGANGRGQLGTGYFNVHVIPQRILTNQSTDGFLDIQLGILHSSVMFNRWCFGKRFDHQDVCSSNGICRERNYCQCYSGWSGVTCNLTTCFGKNSNVKDVCNSRGSCLGLDQCFCFNITAQDGKVGPKKYDGKACEITRCKSWRFLGPGCDDPTFSFMVLFWFALTFFGALTLCIVSIVYLVNWTKKKLSYYRIVKTFSTHSSKDGHVSEKSPLLEIFGSSLNKN